MTRRDNLPEVTILCEDIDQERFIREYLICRGWDDRQIKDFGNPKGRNIKNNNALIVKYYPEIIKSYRRRSYRNLAVVVMIDADEETLHERMRSFHSLNLFIHNDDSHSCFIMVNKDSIGSVIGVIR